MLTPGPDGYRIWFDGQLVGKHEISANAATHIWRLRALAARWAREANAMLAASLENTKHRRA